MARELECRISISIVSDESLAAHFSKANSIIYKSSSAPPSTRLQFNVTQKPFELEIDNFIFRESSVSSICNWHLARRFHDYSFKIKAFNAGWNFNGLLAIMKFSKQSSSETQLFTANFLLHSISDESFLFSKLYQSAFTLTKVFFFDWRDQTRILLFSKYW